MKHQLEKINENLYSLRYLAACNLRDTLEKSRADRFTVFVWKPNYVAG